ncbi:MAG: DUF420 domain-containing protein [Bryobacteraceae bacterium]|nr:DUF420 domain-containing protein [Bryobacteraceae bacterium]MDW8376915.1 DUF420 domain-containing protein [Bryobacterales bacterium]
MKLRDLPTVNAILNATAATLLLLGYTWIRQGKKEAHRKAMLGACAVSALFLLCYLIYHFQVGSVKFQKTGPIRTVYFAILMSHTALAATVPVLAILTLRLAFTERFSRHRALARWTLPIWMYVSVTGVLVYWMLYRL